jgi:hypothetical protein
LETKSPIPVHRSETAPDFCLLDYLSYYLGGALGRWDIRYATGEWGVPRLPDPCDPLPVCPPGQLQNASGLPLTEEEFERDYVVCPPSSSPRPKRRGAQQVERGRDPAIVAEACEILGDLPREYFRAAVFHDHQALPKSPQACPITGRSTASGGYPLITTTDSPRPVQCLRQFIEPDRGARETVAHVRSVRWGLHHPPRRG